MKKLLAMLFMWLVIGLAALVAIGGFTACSSPTAPVGVFDDPASAPHTFEEAREEWRNNGRHTPMICWTIWIDGFNWDTRCVPAGSDD